MRNIHSKTLQDLEFPTVLTQLAARCNTELGKERALDIQPYRKKEELMAVLGQTSEYLASFSNDNRIPNHGFDHINSELGLLKIDNSTLEITGFRKIGGICKTVEIHQKFFKKFKEYYPLLFDKVNGLELHPEIPEAIDAVIDKFGEVKDSASNDLRLIRMQINEVRSKINQSFSSALGRYQSLDFLDEIRESVMENRRVLAVKAMHRKKVKGTVMGTSKTGSIVYIVPEATLSYTRELSNLEFEEKEEIQRILNQLTDQIRPYLELLKTYQSYLAETDITAAKAKYANEMNGLLPDINEKRELYLRDAFHPLLYLSNKRKNEKTWPQTIKLHTENRIIVISGPNAGGKSITLKTIGLLQVMLQSGMLIPVHERSSVCFFDQILTDIGDNQSIENHLSTYSYRLKNMNRFLRKCNERTLFLIDEFGTGSDPELGGALAEAFLEVFYEREAYGVITTHYANLKALANELPHATNANMLFNAKTLEPTFQLVLGEAGSSFTFEVAQKNGIPYSLINKAKKKIERGKVRFDATIAKLQKERSKMVETGSKLKEEEIKAREENERLEKLNSKIKSKLESYQEMYDHNQRMIQLGNKVNTAAEKYFIDKKKRPLISEMLRIVETENSKRRKTTAKKAKAKQQEQQQVAQELEQQIKKVRVEKKIKKKKEIQAEKNKPRPVFKVGDRVRLQDGKAVGSIDTLEKGKAVVNYGMFTTNVSVDQLELVEAKK
ncbi:MAG: DNA mismatch repair protein MutS [Muricauda sp.]|jgi:DNA mismatch repair protein MutS2|nr:DNA mismatch repair protein MutS [Allomuricauda sp.]MBO6589263.1 DNA mismatch repair protein MutS [Allomuricauda sp.]MBO6618888.1 DNA mismatch repair protein MutS [Allomuricauda sp.]MBO6644801.1 DNA mismatch repair protein MutS [Allomuricauda sp.]MBO6746701.1 DNA mismatch repair protein MutS [Allomuricauda sp.]MBO6843216.1 DNA mismatch repair protein MutS [Allomuricauda sp.]